MKIERGVEAAGLRLRIILQSDTVESHSAMCDNAEFFTRLVDELGDSAQDALRTEQPRSRSVDSSKPEGSDVPPAIA